MTERRDKRGHFIKGNVPWNKKRDSPQREMNSLVAPEVIGGEVLKPKLVPVMPRVIGGRVLKLERVRVVCPACRQEVEAVDSDGRVKGYCTIAKQFVDFEIEAQ